MLLPLESTKRIFVGAFLTVIFNLTLDPKYGVSFDFTDVTPLGVALKAVVYIAGRTPIHVLSVRQPSKGSPSSKSTFSILTKPPLIL